MDARDADRHTDVERVRQQRATNKVFGLIKPKPWSGAKQLIDFLDDLFNQGKSADAKVEKPVREVNPACGMTLTHAAPLPPRGRPFFVAAAVCGAGRV